MKSRKVFKWLGFILLIIVIVAAVAVGILLNQGYQRYQEAINEKPINQAIEEITSKNNYVPYEDISPSFVDAIVAVEDHRFFTRYGVDYYSIARAFVANALSGEIVEGGSTITQQVAKNIYFSHAASITRKVAEIYFVDALEGTYSKEEILAVYANIIYYGDGYYGIYDASMGYFNKKPSELTLYEASLLAGLPQSPSNYQLSNGYQLANERQIRVLQAMVKYEYITQKEMDEAVSKQPK